MTNKIDLVLKKKNDCDAESVRMFGPSKVDNGHVNRVNE